MNNIFLTFLVLCVPSGIVFMFISEPVGGWKYIRFKVLTTLGLSVACYFFTKYLIPHVKEMTLKRGLAGRDINKSPKKGEEQKLVPESLGIVSATVFMLALIVLQLKPFSDFETANETSLTVRLVEYDAALASICFMVFLGFADDVLELRWRYKMILPALGSLPLLAAYQGSTTVLLPVGIRFWGGDTVDLGFFYLCYMGFLTIFCANSINIYAGINGLEAGQSIVIALAVVVHNCVQIGLATPISLSEKLDLTANFFALVIMFPFLGCTFGLLYHNWYPSTVFVGDTFTLFAGTTFAVVGILGHQSKTLLLFFGPQILNFVLSLPQLLGLIECPRHRVPRLNSQTGLLEDSGNLTLINMYLKLSGPLHERTLCIHMLALQVLFCSGAFLLRYFIANLLY
eukprot:GCRY01001323.1.p1 GENE.GCRY01001323.1~~GCRY01001323.1.p1  ORF type:complete len:425 (-),score=-0.44 GCRY01001323.1:62-1261(-)